MPESEVVRVRDVLLGLGILMPGEEISRSDDLPQLRLPSYPGLTSDIGYRLPATDLLPTVKPVALNL